YVLANSFSSQNLLLYIESHIPFLIRIVFSECSELQCNSNIPQIY
ncbi:12407_t:CDS:1, partial [Entrophospora sp. SA101]